jgi:hypothetical protein
LYALAGLALGAALLPGAPLAPLTITTTSLPDGALNVAYPAQTLTYTGGYPNTVPTWSISSGQLPTGITLTSGGVISGTPTAGGLFSFTVMATQTDAYQGPPLTATQPLSIFVSGAPLAIATSSPLPGGTTGVAYSEQFTSSGGLRGGVLTWSLIAGTLPAGLTFSKTGLLSGTPTSAGSYSLLIQVVDQVVGGGSESATQAFTLSITNPATLITITTNSMLPVGTVGVAYSVQFAATGGTPPYTWAIQSGTLPAGISLNAKTGLLSGTPTASGYFSFQLTASDQFKGSGEQAFTLVITPTLTISTAPALPNGAVGAPYSTTLVATGGTAPYAWSLASGSLPAGLALNPSTGRLAGTPTANGSFRFVAEVTDAAGNTASKPFTLIIAPLLIITTASPLPDGIAGSAYQEQLTVTGGTAPYTWSLASGSLPAGLALNPSTGSLTGTPTSSGSYQFVVGATDAARNTVSKPLTLNIDAVLTITTTSPLQNGTAGSAYQVQFAATGGVPPYTWSTTAVTLPAGLRLNPTTGILSGTPMTGGAFNFSVEVKDALQSFTAAFALTIGVPPLPAVSITGLPATASPASQPALGIGLSGAYALDLTGQATLTFVPDSGSGDPAVQFTSGGLSVDFQIPAGTTQAVFGSSAVSVQTGTVAGTITITLRLFAAGVEVTPTPAPTAVIQIAAAPPVIVSAKLVSNPTGFDLLVTGYSTTREVTGATVNLVPVAGTKLATSAFTIPLTIVFATWYQSTASAQYGSQFTLDIPFAVEKVANAVGSLTVTLTNSQGTSPTANATF